MYWCIKLVTAVVAQSNCYAILRLRKKDQVFEVNIGMRNMALHSLIHFFPHGLPGLDGTGHHPTGSIYSVKCIYCVSTYWISSWTTGSSHLLTFLLGYAICVFYPFFLAEHFVHAFQQLTTCWSWCCRLLLILFTNAPSIHEYSTKNNKSVAFKI